MSAYVVGASHTSVGWLLTGASDFAERATSSGRVPDAWCKLSPFGQFWQGQEDTLAALSRGRDVLSRQKTNSGKSLTFQLPALAEWLSGWKAYAALDASEVAETRQLRQLPPLTVLVAPFVALCDDQEREATEYFRWAFESGLVPVQVQALYARAAPSPRPATAAAAAAKGDIPSAPSGATLKVPCGKCGECKAARPQKCHWCCRVEWPEGRETQWCWWCKSKEGTGKRSSRCEVRKRLMRDEVGLEPSQTTRSGGAAIAATAAATTAAATDADVKRPRRLQDLAPTAPERQIGENPHLALLIVTPDAFLETERGELLRVALAKSGRIRRVVFDEAHSCHEISQASFRPACRLVGVALQQLKMRLQVYGHEDGFQILALTGTLPPAFEEEVRERLRLAEDCIVLRGPVDRESVALLQVTMPEARTHGLFVLAGWRLLLRSVPQHVRKGRWIFYVTKALYANRLAAFLCTQGCEAVPYCTNGMTLEERVESLRLWRGNDQQRVLIATGAFGQGINQHDVTLVGHFGLPADPLEWWQMNGRIRSNGIAVTFMRPSYVIERLSLPAPADRAQATLDGALQLLSMLTHAGCLRACIVGWLGGRVQVCGGCTFCTGCTARSAVSASQCGSLAYLMQPIPARVAAIALLRALRTDGECLLSSVVNTLAIGAPAPFDAPAAHEALVLSLIGSKHIELRLRSLRSGLRGLMVLARVRSGAVADLELRGEEVFVWVSARSAAGVVEAGEMSREELASAAQTLSYHIEQLKYHRDVARRLLMYSYGRGATATQLELDQAEVLNLRSPAVAPQQSPPPQPAPTPLPSQPAPTPPLVAGHDSWLARRSEDATPAIVADLPLSGSSSAAARSTGATQPVSPLSAMGSAAATAAADVAERAAAKRTPGQIAPSPPVRDAGADTRDLDVSSFPSFAAMELEPPADSSPGKRVVQACKRASV